MINKELEFCNLPNFFMFCVFLGNCYDRQQYKDYFLFCPFAYRLSNSSILVKVSKLSQGIKIWVLRGSRNAVFHVLCLQALQ